MSDTEAPMEVDAGEVVVEPEPVKEMDTMTALKEVLKIYKLKQRSGVVDRVDKNGAVIVKDLFEKNSDITRFLNMKLVSPEHEVGVIDGPFGKSGKVKVSFNDPDKIKKNMKLIMHFKKYIFDENKKKMYQN